MDGIIDSVDMDLSQLWDMVKDREAWRAEAHGSHVQIITAQDNVPGKNLY